MSEKSKRISLYVTPQFYEVLNKERKSYPLSSFLEATLLERFGNKHN